MYARYLNAPLLLLVWQVAPVELRRDEGGRARFGVTLGGGAFTFRDHAAGGLNCNGQEDPGAPASTDTDRYETVGFTAEVRASERVRVHAAYGWIEDQSGQRDGQFFGGQAVYEKSAFGFGLGLASFGGAERTVRPSALARFTPVGGVSLQADYHHPNGSMGLIGGPRLGLAINQTDNREIRAFLGMATTAVRDSSHRIGGFLEGSVPIEILGRRAGINLSVFVGGWRGKAPEHRRELYSLGLGAWIEP